MGLVNWYMDKISAVQQLPRNLFLLFVFSKVFGAFAMGILAASYITGVEWTTAGWIILIAAFAIGIPEVPRIFKPKK